MNSPAREIHAILIARRGLLDEDSGGQEAEGDEKGGGSDVEEELKKEEGYDEKYNVSRGRRDGGREHEPLEGHIGVAAIAKVERMAFFGGRAGGSGGDDGGGVARGQN